MIPLRLLFLCLSHRGNPSVRRSFRLGVRLCHARNMSQKPEPSRVLRLRREERPDRTTYAYVQGEAEDRVIRSIVAFLQRAGFKLIYPIFDSAIVSPSKTNEKGEVGMILTYANEQHGVVLATSCPIPGRLNEPVWDSYPKRRTDSDGINLIPLDMESRILLEIGPNMCLPYAVASLFPDALGIVDYARNKKDGPYTLQEIIDECAEPYVNAGVGPFAEAGAYVAILPPDRRSLWRAVGIRLQSGGNFVVFDSSQSRPSTFQLPCTPARIFADAAVFSLAYGGVLNSGIRFAVSRIIRPPYPEVGRNADIEGRRKED